MFSFFRKFEWPQISFDEIKKRARLLVIDDHGFPYQGLFERDGYTIEKWPDVTDLPKLESGYYDIVLLDLHGVGREQSADQGLGILRHLRRVAPAQITIAYSNADWSLRYQEFFNLADAVLPKSSDYVDFKRQVDDLLQKRFSLGFYVTRVQTLAAIGDPDRIDKLVRKAVKSGSTRRLQEYLAVTGVDHQIIGNVLNVIQIAVGLAALWKR